MSVSVPGERRRRAREVLVAVQHEIAAAAREGEQLAAARQLVGVREPEPGREPLREVLGRVRRDVVVEHHDGERARGRLVERQVDLGEVAVVEEAVRDFRGKTEPSDDATMVALRFAA